MAKLGKEILDAIEEAAGQIDYGSITIHLVESSNAVDIEVNKRLRFTKDDKPAAGRVVMARRVQRPD